MAKEIKIRIKDFSKLEFELMEDAQKGDYISLNSINQIDLSEIKDILETKKNEFYKPYKEAEREEIINAAINKFLQGDQYKKLVSKKQDLELENIKLKTELNSKIDEYKQSDEFKKIQNNTENLKQKIIELETRLKNEKNLAINEYKNSSDYLNLLKENNDFRTNEAVLKNEINNAVSKYKSSDEYLDFQKRFNDIKNNNFKLESELKTNSEISIINFKKSDEYKNLLEKEKKLIEVEAKFKSDLQNEIQKINNAKEIDILNKQRKIDDLNNKLNEEKNNNLIHIENLKKEYSSELKIKLLEEKPNIIKEYQNSDEYINLIKSKENLEREIAALTYSQNLKNVKNIGEDLENWIMNQYNETFSLAFNDVIFEKANNVIDNTKPDFLFTVINKNLSPSDPSYNIGTVVIEAKNESIDSQYHKKNSDHFKKLDSDRKKNNGEYAVLVTNLERENPFSIYLAPGYENMFVVRPEWLMPLLSLLHKIFLKEDSIKQLDIEFKEKLEIEKMFEDFTDNLLENSFKNMQKKLENISNLANKIIDNARLILQEKDTIVSKHMITMENKIKNFTFKKVARKIDKIETETEIKKLENNISEDNNNNG